VASFRFTARSASAPRFQFISRRRGKSLTPNRGSRTRPRRIRTPPHCRDLACETLQALGYSILTARDGEEAVAEFDEHRDEIDLLLFDVVLPKMNGPKAYAQISKLKQGVPVIFVTGYSADIALLQEAQQQGLTVLQKPYDPRDLARRIRDTLDLQSVKVQRA
jgi:CheY-like chemotaxis protein